MNRWQQVLNQGLAEQQKNLNPQQQKVFNHLRYCKTEQSGSETYACESCGFEQVVVRSCRDRHCPSCQYRAALKWCEARRQDILPVTYFHLVFTLPASLNGWVSSHATVIYRLLFESVWATLNHFGRAPNRLNGQLGGLAVLHTWGQTLVRHVHLHCLIPGGALNDNGSWHSAKSNYLFPVKALSRHYRGRMVSALREASEQGLLSSLPIAEVDSQLNKLMQSDWVVYSKAASYGHEKLIDYLGRYTRKIAFSPSRIVSFDGEQVQFNYRDYRSGQQSVISMTASELVRRFKLHVLPKGFMRVRYYGFLANSVRRKKLKEIRQAMQAPLPTVELKTEVVAPVCPQCGDSHWQFVGRIIRWHWQPG